MMKAAVLVLGVVAATGCHPRADPALAQAPADDPDLAPLEWLSGSWLGVVDGARVEEHWTRPAGGSMLGMARTVAAGKTAFFEYLRIEATDAGIVFLASPLGAQPPTAFALVEHAGQSVSFENPEHDFPQRITYRREQTTLYARIEGVENDEPVAHEWTYLRAE